jgi:hypothetical protein
MVFELVKNSLRAVEERYMNSDKDPPPIRIIVADGLEDVTIKVTFVNHYDASVLFTCYYHDSLLKQLV